MAKSAKKAAAVHCGQQRAKLDYRGYPTEQEYRSGCKVSWYIYDSRADAEACSEAAKHNARIDRSLGYDFGFCSPGSITVLPDGRFEVCIP
jgi:hypothetical protein